VYEHIFRCVTAETRFQPRAAASTGAFETKWAAEDNKQSALKLDEAAERMAAASEMLQASFGPLASKIEEVAKAAEAAA